MNAVLERDSQQGFRSSSVLGQVEPNLEVVTDSARGYSERVSKVLGAESSMPVDHADQYGAIRQWVVGQTEPSGQYTAQVVGVPELRATAASRAEAIGQVQTMIQNWVAAGRLVAIEVPLANPAVRFSGHLDPNDPLEQEFRAELARQRQKDLEDTLREDGDQCPNSCSTPTT